MQRVVLVKAGYLAEKLGYNVTILTTNTLPAEDIIYPVSTQITVKAIKPVKNNAVKYFFSYKHLINMIVDEVRPDIIIMCDNGLKSFFLPFILNKKLPLVYERHGSKFLKDIQPGTGLLSRVKEKISYRMMNFCGSRFDSFVTLTENGAKEWPFRNVKVIHNPLWFDTSFVSPLKNKRALTVARHTYEKGYDRLFKIWKEVTLLHPDWVLDVYGNDNPDYDVRQLAIDHGLAHQVSFHTPVKDIVDVYKEASLYLMASRYEGFGMVLLEAMACGVPCISFNCPTGPEEIIKDGRNGFLIPNGDINQFVERVVNLIEDHNLRAEMGARAKEHSASFSIDVIMKQWDDLFRVLAKAAN